MSVSDRYPQAAAHAGGRKYAARYFALIARKPKRKLGRPSRLQLGLGVFAALALLLLVMCTVDAASVGLVLRLPEWASAACDRITGLGRSPWFLTPIALMLAGIAALDSAPLSPMSQRVLAALAVRLGFLFWAIALPGLAVTVLKRLVGRGRPLVAGTADPFLYAPLGWNVDYSSFPSGHATDAFAAAMAIGALWPATRPYLWTYAVLIALSRVVLLAHFPSDVLGGAMAGAAGVLAVRAWFARCGFAFAVDGEGHIRPMPGPSFARLKRVARELIAP
jgi:undecaprenyl-diphosphatase